MESSKWKDGTDIYRVMMSKERVIVPEIGNLSVNRFHISSVLND